MRICSKCKNEKDDDEFVLKCKKTGRRQTKCRGCCKEYAKEHYRKNKPYYIKRARVFNDKQVEKNRRLLYDYLQSKKCVDCGNSDIRVLEFDHKRGLDKRDNVGNMLYRYSWKTVLEEIEKCEIRCANCHRIKTMVEFGFYRSK